ncbi:hypothetical protein RHODGE_RHODGE_01035 [Rhodoplanes serenus]|uniref:Bacteriophage tail tape measure N-terminal domain-containing protein n=1 Tax=Rhodoplanes serenus TaxID=200615 RepID=A0A3S4BSW9_9BRAD|nr:phage tail length tape measure family protein [Rhodoplanes serenus]VCU06572.1 hypothetical protein RHODPL_RHODPL_00020 [Rhodoplanes serenus]VCU07885.1 hypothetical protein RHODGE_RHODGE_01035 [Rhodoplanes serenus]
MDNVASLGLSIESGPVRSATADLAKFERSGVAAAAAASAFERAMDKGGQAVDGWARKAQQAARLADEINRKLSVKDSFGGAARAADIAAYGSELDRLRAKFNPLFGAQQQYRSALIEIGQAARVGAISERERAAAIERTKAAFAAQVVAIRGVDQATTGLARSLGLSRGAMQQLTPQINDIVQGLMLGVSPMQIMMQQGPQVVQALQMSEGGLARFGKGMLALITPARLAAGGILAIGAAAATAAVQWGEAQRSMSLALVGAGRASGATIGGLSQLANDNASLFGLSVSEARELATALAATGKVGAAAIGPIVSLGHDIAKVYGIDASDAAKMLAKAFSDPAQGANQLNQRLGFMDAAMQRNIANLQAQNRLFDAQMMLYAGVKSGLDGVGQSISTSTKFWTALGNTVSNAWGKLGEFAARTTGIGLTRGLDEQIDATKARIAELEALMARRSDAVNRKLGTVSALERERKELERLTGEWQRYWQSVEDAQSRRDSLVTIGAVNRLRPEIAQLDQLRNDHLALALAMKAVNMTGGESSTKLAELGRTYQQLTQDVADAAAKVVGFKSATDMALAQARLQIEAVGARSPSARADIARRESLIQTGDTAEGRILAEARAALALKQAQQGITDAMNARLLSAQQSTEMARLELDLVGRSVGEQERMRGAMQARHQLEQDALQNYGSRDAYDKAHLAALTEQVAKQAQLKQLLAEQQLMRDVQFDTATLGMSSIDQQIASRLRQTYGDSGWQSQMNGALAAQMRFNDTLRQASQLGSDFATGFVSDLRNGVSAIDALTNAVNRLADRLIQMALDTAIKGLLGNLAAAFGPAAGGVGSTAFSGYNMTGLPGAATGGYITGPGSGTSDSLVARVSNGEYVVNAAATARHRPMLDAINFGVPRFAAGGLVGAANSNGGGAPMLNVVVNEAPGTRAQVSQGDDGGLVVDVITPLENALGERRSRGRGALAKPRQLRG